MRWEATEDSKAMEWQDQPLQWLCGGRTGEREPRSWKGTRENASSGKGKRNTYLSRWKVGNSLKKVWLWPNIAAKWNRLLIEYSACCGGGGRGVCRRVDAKFQRAETTHSNSCRKLRGQQATCWHPDWCRQGSLCLIAERQSICVRSSSQKPVQ